MDVRCIVCGEPWDFLGLLSGDVEPWEARLIKAGAGCPSCEGNGGDYEPEVFDDVECGDEDPMERILAIDPANRPKWEEPPCFTIFGAGVPSVPELSYEYNRQKKDEDRDTFTGKEKTLFGWVCPLVWKKDPQRYFIQVIVSEAALKMDDTVIAYGQDGSQNPRRMLTHLFKKSKKE